MSTSINTNKVLGSTSGTSIIIANTYAAAFTSTWLVTAGETITLPYEVAGTYSGTIDWGDSSTSTNSYANKTHTYAGAGTYTISITGVTTGFRFANTGSRLNITTITNWGTLRLGNNNGYFHGCSNLTLTTVVGALDFSGTTDLSNMFNSCSSLTTVNGINSWSTGSVTNMANMFNGCTSFSQELSFNTAAVTNMSSMFNSATAFNDLLTFNTAAVTTMQGMFFGCTNFNKPLTFNTASVTNMSFMFAAANAFNQPLSFNTAAVTDMSFMFFATTVFNQDISSWNTAAVTDMSQMFFGSAFNQNIGSWNVANVTNFSSFMAAKTPATFSTTNLNAIYNGWSASGVKPNINISFGGANFTNAGGLIGKNILLGAPNNWIILDGGGI